MTKQLAFRGQVPHAVMTAMANVPPAVRGTVTNEATPNAAQMLEQLTNKVDEMAGPLKATAEKALAEAMKHGAVTEETKATADKALADAHATNAAVETLKALVEGIDSKVLDVSQQLAAGTGRGGAGEVMSLGQAVVAEEDKIKGFVANSCNGQLLIKVQNSITTATPGGGGLIYHEEERVPVRMPRRALRIRSLLTAARTASDAVHYRKQVTRTSGAAPTAEEASYPESSYGWDKATAAVKKIAHHTNISEEAMADADQLQSEIDTEMRYGLDLEEEQQLLAGDGVGENLSGLLTEATAFSAAAGLPDATRIDRLRLAILQVTLADYMASSIVLNPTDWAGIDLLKVSSGTDERYVFGNPGSPNPPRLWGLDVVESNSMTAGSWLCGDLAMAATIYDRADAEILISSEHGTNFVDGMLTMRGMKRLALAIKRPAAMVTGNFTFA